MPDHNDVLSLYDPSNIYLGGTLHRGGQRRRNVASIVFLRHKVVRLFAFFVS